MTPSNPFAKEGRGRSSVSGAPAPVDQSRDSGAPRIPASTGAPAAGSAATGAPKASAPGAPVAPSAGTAAPAAPSAGTVAPAGKTVPPPEKAATGKAEVTRPIIDEVRTMSTTRAAAAWLATAVSLVILVLLIILILENQQTVSVKYLGLQGSLPLGTALLIAAVAGGAIVTIVGVVRLTQLRIMARRARRRELSATKAETKPATKAGTPPA